MLVGAEKERPWCGTGVEQKEGSYGWTPDVEIGGLAEGLSRWPGIHFAGLVHQERRWKVCLGDTELLPAIASPDTQGVPRSQAKGLLEELRQRDIADATRCWPGWWRVSREAGEVHEATGHWR